MKRRFNWFADLVKLIVLCLNLSLGINVGFIIDTWLHPVFKDWEWAGFVVALVSGLLIAAGSFGLFIKTEIAVKAISRIKSTLERRLRYGALTILILLFVGVGCFGLLYRLEFLQSQGVGFLVVIGIMLECAQPLFGLVLHPIENPPVEVLDEDLGAEFERSVVSDSYALAQNMPLHQRIRAFNGDFTRVLGEQIEEGRRTAPKSVPSTPPRRLLTGSRKNSGDTEDLEPVNNKNF